MKRQIPRPDRLKTCQSALDSYSNNMDRSIIDDDFANMDDVSETCDEGQRPFEAINTITSRDTPLKRNALAVKQKGTYRGARRGSKKKSGTAELPDKVMHSSTMPREKGH